MCLAVTCCLHFWQNDWDLLVLHATAVTWGPGGIDTEIRVSPESWPWEKKIHLLLLPGLKPKTFWLTSLSLLLYHWAIPICCCCCCCCLCFCCFACAVSLFFFNHDFVVVVLFIINIIYENSFKKMLPWQLACCINCCSREFFRFMFFSLTVCLLKLVMCL